MTSQSLEVLDNGEVQIDFTGVDYVPEGEVTLTITKAELKTSSNGNKMISIQYVISDAVEPKAVNRIIFDNWMLQGKEFALRRTHEALNAFVGQVPAGPASINVPGLVGQSSECYLEAEQGDRGMQSRVKRYGPAL